ncbi:hypothetical protein Leryth_015413 [Lithospermum erythrorhizon]|nr:hypothetical protein Leryth_015413 [Lithospermum erythrorhizon]
MHQFNTFSMKEILGKYKVHSSNPDKTPQPTLGLQLVENSEQNKLSQEVAEKTSQLRQMRGEELQGLTIEELHHLEKTLETGLTKVLDKKNERFMDEIANLQKESTQLCEENDRLKRKMAMIKEGKRPLGLTIVDDVEDIQQVTEEGQSSESFTTNLSAPPSEDDYSDTSLKLGLPFN